jgi:AbrB family looped-hinge helix DNA binding protein
MITTIDHAGRLVIPKEIRDLASLKGGTVLDVRWEDGRVVVEPAPVVARLAQKGRFMVAQAPAGQPILTSEAVEATRSAVRGEGQG